MRYEIDGKPVILKAGDAIYVPAGGLRKRFETPNGEYVSYLSVNLTGGDALISGNYFKNALNADCMRAIELMNKAFTYGEDEKIVLLTLYIIEEFKSKIKAAEEDPRVLLIKNFVYNEIYGEITVKKIADCVCLSKIYCESFFKKHTGTTLTEFIATAKIEVAINHMRYDDLTLSEISEKLNFTDYNYFSRVFKKITGISPKRYLTTLRSSTEYFVPQSQDLRSERLGL